MCINMKPKKISSLASFTGEYDTVIRFLRPKHYIPFMRQTVSMYLNNWF